MDQTPEAQDPPEEPQGVSKTMNSVFGMLIFGFGLAAGIMLAFSGYALLEGSASLVVTIFLAALFVVTLVSALVFALRKPILRALFGVASTQIELFASPLSDVADAALGRDAPKATAAARRFVQMTLARYAWLSTRRWIVASLTGLIAAMAALAGTALLFKQNQLLQEQNTRVATQTELLVQQVQLAEAQRNAEIAVQITEIANLLGGAMERRGARLAQDSGGTQDADAASLVGVLNPYLDLGPSLIMRITSASRAAKPYRFILPPYRAHDDRDKLRVAMESRRGDLTQTYDTMAAGLDWRDPPEQDALIDRPASPERAALLEVLMRAGLRDYGLLNFFGLDLSFAHAEDIHLLGLTLQGAQLSFASFDRAQISQTDFAGAAMENTRFRGARISASQFRGLPYREAAAPYNAESDELMVTGLSGADFSEAVIAQSDFSQLNGGAMVFDRAALHGVSFAGASLGATTFRGAVLLDVDFTGAGLQSVDFDGAYVFRADILDQLAEVAQEGSFVRDRFRLREVPAEAWQEVNAAFVLLSPEIIAESGGEGVWHVERVGAFETAPEAEPPG
ncbi:pentapeptide repeat-containing protein [Pseudooceanicola nanhaiensis]|uniref:pentapeptide repeat-containing protein n=1 Tax=Pseudooceanicola nanhaiensis TaxID=375761 RepID=UPI001CD6C31B|nr:pentapeptide repeat-containing protein [Pseudooceanicola nanhaiensis]MCA0922733.1 pentapeptide repeat-containing protein [Pseudooceanicola nanhaiensis]